MDLTIKTLWKKITRILLITQLYLNNDDQSSKNRNFSILNVLTRLNIINITILILLILEIRSKKIRSSTFANL